jgi:hypothetical protein
MVGYKSSGAEGDREWDDSAAKKPFKSPRLARIESPVIEFVDEGE